MKRNDNVILINPMWKCDSVHIGKVGTLKIVPTRDTLGAILIDQELVYTGEWGFVPVSSLIKELF